MRQKSIFSKAIDILVSEGWKKLLRSVFYYLKPTVTSLYLLNRDLTALEEPSVISEFPEEMIVYFVRTKQELDSMISERFDILSIPAGIDSVIELLNRGAIAQFVFVGHELAHWGFLAMNQRAMDAIVQPYHPYHVDFANHEAYGSIAYTVDKFRGKGLMGYADSLRFKYYKENGIVFVKGLVEAKNLSAIRAHIKKDAKVYGKGLYIYIRILRWKYWKETLFPQPVFLRDLTSTLKR